jgi:hypothetical protein
MSRTSTYQSRTHGTGKGLSVLQVLPNGSGSGAVERNDSLLSAFTQHSKQTPAQVEVLEIDAYELAQSETRGIEELQDGSVTST